MRTVDPLLPIEVVPGTHWVGVTDPQTPFKSNPYVLDSGGDVVLFEPGAPKYFPGVLERVRRLGLLKRIRYILASHQDPDVIGSLPLWERELGHTQFTVLTHSRTAVLLKAYGFRSRIQEIDRTGWNLRLGARELQFLFAPWCHCPGSFMTYDPATKVLFSGDIFGALTFDWTPFATGASYREAMRAFHEDYMASSDHLRDAMGTLDGLDIERILPQHGSIVEDGVPEVVEFLRTLECGRTLLVKAAPAKPQKMSEEERYRAVIDAVLARQIGVLGTTRTLEVANAVPGLKVDAAGKVISLTRRGEPVLTELFQAYGATFGPWAILGAKILLLTKGQEFAVPLPAALKNL